ncbi:hypothetical protein [Moraxella lacunata]
MPKPVKMVIYEPANTAKHTSLSMAILLNCCLSHQFRLTYPKLLR